MATKKPAAPKTAAKKPAPKAEPKAQAKKPAEKAAVPAPEVKEKALPSLKAMAEAKVEGISKTTNFTVDPHKVELEEGFNLREAGERVEEHRERMYRAMKAGVVFPPIEVIVRDGTVFVRDGHNRVIVGRRLRDEGIPYMLEARHFRGNEVDATKLMLGSDQGLKFTPLEQGRGFLRLVRYGLTISQIADETGFHRSSIDNGLALAEAPVAIQKMLSENKVGADVVLEALRKHKDKAEEYLTRLIEKAGEQKVTKKHTVEGPRVVPKVAVEFFTATKGIRDIIGDRIWSSLMQGSDDMLADKTVSVPAPLLRDLMKVCEKVEPRKEDEL